MSLPQPVQPSPWKPSAAPVSSDLLKRKCPCGGTPGPTGECEDCKKKKEKLGHGLVQRRAAGTAQPSIIPPIVHETLGSPGHPLDASTRAFMEPRFGHDFSQVRVHTDSRAGDSARAINAHAYTSGNDIAFAPGKYQPDSHSGRHLLAHELAHTVQQARLQRRASDLSVDTAPDSRFEREADRVAHSVVNGANAPIIANRPPAAAISRAKDDIVTKPVTGKKKKKPKASKAGTHNVTPTGVGTKEIDDKGGTATLEEFSVEPFFLPAEKGPNAFGIYNSMANGGSLESTLELTGSGRTKTALWQERPDTDDLRHIWLQKVGWDGQTSKVVNDLWQRSGGDAEFPKVNTITAQMDHIVELQIGGNNTKENLQPLDPKPNQSSGGSIKAQLQTLAQAIATDTDLSGGNAQQIKMRFTKVEKVGTAPPLSATCPPKGAGPTALAVEACAMKLSVTKGADGSVAVARADYPISTKGRPVSNLKVPVTFATRADETVAIKGNTENDAASTLIPGLLLNKLSHRGKKTAKPDLVEAQIDDRDKTRLPITLDKNAKPFSLDVAPDGTLTLPKTLAKTSLGFTYKYLSLGTITSVAMNATGGIDWRGNIRPTAKFLPTLDVEYKDGALGLVAQIPQEKLKKQKLFGATVTKASLNLLLSPKFDATGTIEFIFGDAARPAAIGKLEVGKDDNGLIGTAKVNLKIPKVDSTEITFEYKGGADRETWSGELKIETAQIRLPYVTGSTIVARVSSKNGITDITFDGKVALELPNKRGTAEVGLKRRGDNWFLAGGAQLNMLPKVENFSAWIVYDITHETLTASVPAEDGKSPAKPIGFTITEDFKGTLDRLNLKIAPGGVITVSGAGGFEFKKGKAAGKVHVDLAADGSFSGTGDITYALSDNLTVDGKVAFNEKGKPRLRFTGSLTFKRLELMKAISDTRTLFDKDFSIPVPYASIGGIGLKATFGVAFTASYSLGPIVVEPLVFTAGFNPLDDEPQLNLGASGELKVPASASLSASLSAGLKIDAYIAEVGGKVTITGTIKLEGGLFVPFTGTYSSKEFSVEMTPEARLKLLLGVALSATAWAKIGIGFLSTGVEKTWDLGHREVDTGLGFGIKAPISYNSRTGAKIPSLDSIQMIPPDFSRENLTRVADRLFGEAKAEPANT
jgi:hypothetical protein